MNTRSLCLSIISLAIWPAIAAAQATASFPTRGLMPKQETGALDFLAKHPDWDGRGVIVAIFDTGIDPGAEGLQLTSTGHPKIIDMIDGTGSGDVAMKAGVAAQDGCLDGLTGRRLHLPPAWLQPERKFHVGLKAAYDFFPDPLIARLKRERRERFEQQQAAVEESLRREIAKLESGADGVTAEQKKLLPELKARLEQVLKAGKSFEDPGPVYDCVTFHDGSVWRAVVDTDEDGDLADEAAMTNYRRQRQWSTFDGTQMNFAVNIYQDGRCLSLVVDSEPHGTHVAGIVAGYYPEEPELNGVAAGAQLVSVKIGDPRLGGMETPSGILRGLRAVLDNHCDLVNMSFGEPSTQPNAAWMSEMLTDLVRKHNVVFVSSAGNAGPALSTVGAPGGTTTAVIGVGAYVSSQMAQAEYAVREQLPDNAYTWSSRGPTYDGDWGVDIFAPGGAFAPVPQWTLNRNQQMNGTSMASPNACGVIALMLSAAKAQGIGYTPDSVLRAIQSTAVAVPNVTPCGQGPGLIQAAPATEYLLQHAKEPGEQLPFDVRVMSRGGARGVYLREPHETARADEYTVMVRPVLPDDRQHKGEVELQFRFALQSTQPWVQVADHLLMASSARAVNVRVDPTGLPPGLHTAEVRGLDAERPDRGPVWRLPITVLVPHHRATLDARAASRALYRGSCELHTGEIGRRYIDVPAGTEWCRLSLHRTDSGADQRMVVHAVQAIPDRPYRDTEMKRFQNLEADGRWEAAFPVADGRLLELCIGQYWSSFGSATVDYELELFGVTVDQQVVSLSEERPLTRVVAGCPWGQVQLAPQASAKSARYSIAPRESQVVPRDPDRDRMPDGRILYGLTLDYALTMDAAASVTPQFPALDNLLYDSPFAGHVWMIFDSGKRRVATGDWRADPVRLGKGEYSLRALIVHTDPAKLDGWRKLPLVIERSLGSPVAVKVFSSPAAAAAGSSWSGAGLKAGQQSEMHFQMPQLGGLPAWLADGGTLLGEVRLVNVAEAPTFPLSIAAPAKARPNGTTASPTVDDDLAKAIRDVRLTHLKQVGAKGKLPEFEQAVAGLLKDFPDYLPIYAEKLAFLDHESRRKDQLPAVVAAADEILKRIDPVQVKDYFASKPELKSAEEKDRHQQMTEQRELLIDTLYRKGRALGYMELPDVVAKQPIADPAKHDKAFEENFAALQQWVDTTDEKYYLLEVRRERRKGNYAKALGLLNKHFGADGPEERLYKKRRDLYESLGWEHLSGPESLWLRLRFPQQFEAL